MVIASNRAQAAAKEGWCKGWEGGREVVHEIGVNYLAKGKLLDWTNTTNEL